jgi:serine/threonine protein kinase
MISVFDIYEDNVHFIYVKETFRKMPLAEYIRINKNKYDEKDIKAKMTPIFAAIAQCHEEGFMHGDLCVENMVVKQEAIMWGAFDQRIKIKGTWQEGHSRFNWKRSQKTFKRIVSPEMMA